MAVKTVYKSLKIRNYQIIGKRILIIRKFF